MISDKSSVAFNLKRHRTLPMRRKNRCLSALWLLVRTSVLVLMCTHPIIAFATNLESRPQDANSSVVPQHLRGESETLLPDGRKLIIGGIVSGSVTNRVFYEIPKTGVRSSISATPLYPRAYHTATILPDGKVFIFGGTGNDDSAILRAEIFDPSTNSFERVLSTPGLSRSHHSATLLTDGRVMVAGGVDSKGKTLSRVDIWDYRSGQWAQVAVPLSTGRSGHTASLLPDGTVLLEGGQDDSGSAISYGEIVDADAPSVRLSSISAEKLLNAGQPRVTASIPQNGEIRIPTGQVISLRFSEPINISSISEASIQLRTSVQSVKINIIPTEGGMLAFIRPLTQLENGTAYTLSIAGATDGSGRSLPESTIIFTTEPTGNNEIDETGSSQSNISAAGWSGQTSTANAGNRPTSEWRKLPLLPAPEGETALAGQVLKLDGTPLSKVLLEIGKEKAFTDDTGRFLLRNLGSGHHIMLVDGGPAATGKDTYGIYRVGVDLKSGETNSLNYVIWMTALDTPHVVHISSPTTSDLVVTNPGVPGVELHIPAGTVIHDARGKLVTQIGITPIPTNQPPFPLKRGAVFPVYFTIQPGGATFSSPGTIASARSSKAKPRGARIHYANRYSAAPGVHFAFWNYDPAQKGWYVYGHGQVTGDSKMIVPDANTQIFSFDGAMVSLPDNAPPYGPKGPDCCDPVNLQTGLFVYRKTDLALQDVIPISLRRTYRQADYVSRAFGYGTSLDYDMFLVGDDAYTPEGYTYQDLILADGARIHFTRTSPCDSDGFCDYTNAVYAATSTPGPFYGAVLQFVAASDSYTVTTKDGTVFQFPDSINASNPRNAGCKSITDRNGNQIVLHRDSHFNLSSIYSTSYARSIFLSYDSNNRIVSASDNTGRTTSYTYNSQGYLATATDANGGVTSYSYDSSGNMLSITDPRGIAYLQNQYDVNDMVSQQTMIDGSVYQLAYTLDSNNNVIQANVTDPRGYHRIVTFNSDGYMTGDTHAVGQPEVQAFTYNVQPGTGLVLGVTDPLNRQTTLSYDLMGNITGVTQLASTSSAATTSFTYDSQFNELASVIDALGNETLFTYDSTGNRLTATDALGNTTTFTYDSLGEPLTITDALGEQTQFAYSNGVLTSIIDPLGRTTSYSPDSAGRIIAASDPLGNTYQYAYDSVNNLKAALDPMGNATLFSYDSNGNLLTLTDANLHTTTFTYNNMDRVATRTDALSHPETFLYDLMGNVSQTTDRKSQVTTYTYDGINRLTHESFNDGSTVANTYDAGNRLTGTVDSISGTISRTYDGFDDLLSETTPQGSVAYTYDAGNRRQTMTASGQSPVNYVFDGASRLTSITQGSANVSFAYDTAGRRTSMTLPNGINAAYGYDTASELTSIVYQGGALAPSDLEYTYDPAGRRVGASGSLANMQLPTAVSSAVYNANNQLTQWGSTSMSYDLNGNTLNDGTNGYTWDARNRLVSANSGQAIFSYDPLGRRVNRNFMAISTSFLYDGLNPIQELNGSTVTANLLTGLGIDERFARTDSGGTANYLTDALGSTIGLTGPTGNMPVQYSYSPFGSISITGTTTNSFTYTGREIDGLGINYYRARYYSPQTGRFLSEDPLGFRFGTDLYAYAYDSPVVFTDPSGKDAISGAVTGAIFGALGAANGGNICDALGGAIAGGIAGGLAGALLPPGPLTGAAAGAAGDLAGQELGNLMNGKSLGNVNGGEIAGSALGGATSGLFSQWLGAMGANAGMTGPALDWGGDIVGSNLGLVGGLLGGMFGGGGEGGGGGCGCSVAGRKC
jgi:RHS repeat-associated protein